VRGFVAGLVKAAEHVGGHMGKDRTTGGEIVLVLGEIRVPQMVGQRLVPVVRLGDEQVRIARRLADRGRPGRVAGISDDLSAQGQPQDEGRRAAGMARIERTGASRLAWSRRMQAWNLAPLPNASPQPANVTRSAVG
jgi:hypothetical protein